MGARDSELPDLGKIDRGLKDFQRCTAAAVFHRLYEQARSTHRFLVADEAGLGKTTDCQICYRTYVVSLVG